MKDKLQNFVPQKRNANKHTQRGMGLLEKSIQADGWIGAITVAADGETFDGSARIEVGAATGFEDAIVVESDGSKPVVVRRVDIPTADDPRAKRLGVAANRVAELNLAWEVDELLASVAEGVDLSAMFRQDELDALLQAAHGQDETAGEDKGAQTDRAAELAATWGTALGQVWGLGAHRLAVGDCTDRATVEAVMRGEKARMMFTDPPWNVAIGKDSNPRHRQREGLQNDDLSPEEFSAFLSKFILLCVPIVDGDVYCVLGASEWPTLDLALRSAGYHWSSTIIWVKDQFVLGRSKYHRRYEPLWYGWHNTTKSSFGDDRTQDDVWEIPRPKVSEEHPTMKPVELVERAVRNSSMVGQIVYEPFSGSGTTLIACEKLIRKCRAIELDEGYAAVAIQRWVDMTGGEPKLLGTFDVAAPVPVVLPDPVERADVPDAIWPTDNDSGVPLLDLSMQADALDVPVTKWGVMSRKGVMRGTYHFYTDDYKFNALWDDPTPVVNSGCVNVIEPNFSTNDQMPRAVALWGIYRKRWLARYWQSKGVCIFVDLNIEPEFADLNLLGVPQGWRAYATRGYEKHLEDTVRQYKQAKERAGGEVLFVVIGGGNAVRDACLMHGWIYVPEHIHVAEGRVEAYGKK